MLVRKPSLAEELNRPVEALPVLDAVIADYTADLDPEMRDIVDVARELRERVPRRERSR